MAELAAEHGDQSARSVSTPRRRWSVVGLSVIATLVLVGVITLFVQQVSHHRNDSRLDADRAATRAIAKAQVLDLTTVDASTVGARLKAMDARTSGSFKRQLQGMEATFSSVVKDSKVASTGVVDATAVEHLSDSKASVLVAASSKVSAAKQAQTATRRYRFRVDMVHTSKGWLVSGMEFVQ